MSLEFLAAAFSPLPAQPFGAAESIPLAGIGGAPRMTYSTSGQMVFGPDHRLSLVFWDDAGDISASIQNHVWLAQWRDETGWQIRGRVDRGTYGARHPAMLLLPGGDLLAAWYDYRDCTAQGGFTDNIEVYSSRWSAAGAPPSSDLRLTSTAAFHTGDNGYVPQLARLPDGRVALAWYDFHWNADIGEIALRLSDVNGHFGAPPPIDPSRLTTAATRAAGDAGKSFTMPQIAADTSGTLHLTWTTGTNETPASLYYGRFNPNNSTWLDGPRRLRTGVRGHFDPPRLAADPQSGDIWMTYVDLLTHGNYDVWIQRRGLNATDWDAPVRLTNSANSENYSAIKIGPDGKPRVAYIETSGAQQILHYLIFDPVANQTAENRTVAAGSGRWISPALALDSFGKAFLVWQNDITLTTSELLFSTNWTRNAAEYWTHFE